MQGSLRNQPICDLFRDLIRARVSGLVFLENGAQQKAVYLSAGRFVNAESNRPEDGLSYRLLDEGIVAPDIVEQALHEVSPGRTLNDVLCASGALDQATAEQLGRSLAQSIILSVFDWTDGRYTFQEGDFGYKGTHALNTPALILEGVRRMFGFETIAQRFLADRRPLRPRTGSNDRIQLEPVEGFILSRVDGSMTTRDICSLSIITEEMTCRVLYGLMASGVIEHGPAATVPQVTVERLPPTAPHGSPSAQTSSQGATSRIVRPQVNASTVREPVPRRPDKTAPQTPTPQPTPTRSAARPRPTPSPDPSLSAENKERREEIEQMFDTLDQLSDYGVLGVPTDAEQATVVAAFGRMSDKYHPRNNAWIVDDELRSKLVFLFAKIGGAFKTLSDPVQRRAYDAQRVQAFDRTDTSIRREFTKTQRQLDLEQRHNEAHQLYEEGLRLFEASRFHDARERALRCIQLDPEVAPYHALLARVAMLNPNIRWQKEAEQHWKKAISLDRWNAEYRIGLAELYDKASMTAKAKREYVRALELDPKHPVALPHVPPAERPKKSLVPPPTADDDDDEVEWD